jgi:uncharacterized protein
VLGNVLAAVIMILMSGVGLADIANINEAIMSSKNGWWAMILGQGVASLITFIISGLLYWYWIEKKKFSDFNFKELPTIGIIALATVCQLAFAPFNGWVQKMNQKMALPASLEPLEKFMKSMEDQMADATKFLTDFNSPLQFVFAFLVIAVIAGIGEELLFRGLIQRKLQIGFKNPHLAIWGAAIIFSAIHMQFYGFLPRVFLGALLGYFYYWTGNLWVPIIAHIVNNGLIVTMLYLSKIKVISTDVEKLDQVPMPAVLGSIAIFGGLMYLLYNKTKKLDSN